MRTHFRSLNDKKLCILGLASILRTPREQLPASVREGKGHLLAALVTLFFDMDVLRRRRMASAEAPKTGADSQGDGAESGGLRRAVAHVADDEDYDPRAAPGTLDGVIAQLYESDDLHNRLFYDDDDFDDADASEDDEEVTPIDAVDEVLFFAEAWDGVEAKDDMLKALDHGQRGFMDSVLASVPQRLALRNGQLTGAAAALGSTGS